MLTRLMDEYARGTELVTGERPAAPEPGPAPVSGWARQSWGRSGWTGRVRPPVRTLGPIREGR